MLRRALEKQKSKTIETDSTQTKQDIQWSDEAANDLVCVFRESDTEEFLTEVLIDESTVGDGVLDDTVANVIAPSKFQDYIDGIQLDANQDISLDENTEESFGREYLHYYLVRGFMRITYTYFG